MCLFVHFNNNVKGTNTVVGAEIAGSIVMWYDAFQQMALKLV